MARSLASTTDGVAFLKEAFAAPDFERICAGVPDQFTGRTLRRKQRFTGNFNMAVVSGVLQDLLVIVPPVPNIACFRTNLPPGAPLADQSAATELIPTEFSDSVSIWPTYSRNGPEQTINLVGFRYVSLCAEIELVSNALNAAGTITAGEFPIKALYDTDANNTAAGVGANWTINGCDSVDQLLTFAEYSKPAIVGAYLPATHSQAAWDFTTVRGIQLPVPTGQFAAPCVYDSGAGVIFTLPRGVIQVGPPSIGFGVFPGWGDHNSIVFRLTGPPSTPAMTVNLKVWATIEYLINPVGVYRGLDTPSAEYDELSLRNYSRMTFTGPDAVPASENDGFWSTLTAAAKAAGPTVAAMLPPPYDIPAVIAAKGLQMIPRQRKQPKKQPPNIRQGVDPLTAALMRSKRAAQPKRKAPARRKASNRR